MRVGEDTYMKAEGGYMRKIWKVSEVVSEDD